MRACQRHFFALVTGLTCVLARDARADRAVITVGDVDTLYEAVNDPGNAGAVVHVRQGLYVLDATVPPFGRLVLQPGMDLVGENQYLFVDGRPAPRDAAGETFADPPSETILDGTALVAGPPGPAGTPPIILANADNAVRNLTVRTSATAVAGIGVNHSARGTDSVASITECILEAGAGGGRRGVQIAHDNDDAVGASSTITIARNVIRHHMGAFGFGVQAVRALTHDDQIVLTMSGNVVYDNAFGLFLPNVLGTRHGSTVAFSSNNEYRDNFVGVVLVGGRDLAVGQGGTQKNLVTLTSSNDIIVNNVDLPEFGGGTGVIAVAALRDGPDPASVSNGNVVSLTLLGTRFLASSGVQNGASDGSSRSDVQVFGSIGSYTPYQTAGANNRTQVLMSGLRESPVPGEAVQVFALDSDIGERNNLVEWIGGIDALVTNNPLIPIIVSP